MNRSDPEFGQTPLLSPARARPWLAVLAFSLLLGFYVRFGVWWVPIVFIGYACFVVFAERRLPTELLGGALAPRDLAVGVLLGAMCIAPALGVVLLQGYDVRYSLGWVLVAQAIPSALAALAEEPLFRGLALRYFELRLGSGLALLLSSGLFGLMHITSSLNPFVWILQAMIGLAFGAAYLVTRRLWLPIALHACINFTTSFVMNSASWHSSGSVLAFLGRLMITIVILVVAVRRRSFVGPDAAWTAQVVPSRAGERASSQRPLSPTGAI